MTSYTPRLKIPLVQEEEPFSLDVWNRAYQKIDQVCLAMYFIEEIIFPANHDSYSIAMDGDHSPYKMIEIHPKDPSNEEEWKRIQMANFRCYIDRESGNLIIQVTGMIPTQNVHLSMMGWY